MVGSPGCSLQADTGSAIEWCLHGHRAHSYWRGSALCLAESRLERNSVAAFLLLVKNFIQNHPVNQESLVQCHGPAIIGALLQKVWWATEGSIPSSPVPFSKGDARAASLTSHPRQVSSPLLDMSTLMASQILMEQVASEGSGLLLHLLYQHLLFDFRIWSNSDFAVRLGGNRGCLGCSPSQLASGATHSFPLQVTSSIWPVLSRTTSSASARSTGCNTSSTPSGRTMGELPLVVRTSICCCGGGLHPLKLQFEVDTICWGNIPPASTSWNAFSVWEHGGGCRTLHSPWPCPMPKPPPIDFRAQSAPKSTPSIFPAAINSMVALAAG